ncbi:hypothetical protein [Roseivirga pacifica]|uniref:hypothetical protein n=1 Tax=Roseivirga pacifica TaxID=1267423 RepID=UPI003BAFC0CF
MDIDFSTLLYIIFGIIYFVFTATKKKGGKGAKRPDETSPEPQRTGPQPTFEELLEEFTGKRREAEVVPQPVVVEEAKPKPAPVVKQPQPSVYNREQERTSHRLMQQPILSVEKDEDPEIDTHELLEDFYEEDGAKKAFIYSEIFKRKY